jgi:hypothetical protein
MALREFLANIRSAGGLISPRAAVDSPRLDARRIEYILRQSHRWLTPKAVEGFDPDDFAFLSKEERRDLQESVDRFLRVAEHVPGSAQASESQLKAAIPAFRKIVKILRPDKYADPDALVIGKRIEQFLRGRLPDWVRELVFDTGSDAQGDPALWIWVEIDDEAAAEDVFAQNTRSAWNVVEMAARKLAMDRWPYIRFRTTSEQLSLSK